MLSLQKIIPLLQLSLLSKCHGNTVNPDLIIPQTSHLDTPTDPAALKSVLAWFDQFQCAHLPYRVWLECQLALTEGFTNAVRHAHAQLPLETPIAIEVTVADDTVDIRIWDRGPGFNLAAVLEQRLASTDRDAEGGRGLKIIYLVADTLSYTPTEEQRNCLHIQKRFAPVIQT